MFNLVKQPKMKLLNAASVFILSAAHLTCSLIVEENSVAGTEVLTNALTSKQLAIQRWFAQLTYLQPRDNWTGWGDAINDVDCDGNTCMRYEISGLAYAAAVLASKTPAYTGLAESIIYDCIMRMIQKPVWQYVELFDDFKDQPTYPDPVAYKNIMYSGHLAQMIALFEATTGNMTFSENGWEFSWGAESEYPIPIPYTTRTLLDAIYNQTQLYDGALGGVPCEPDSIFVICNNYPMNAFVLSDQLHGTSFAASAVQAWQGTVSTHGVNKLPDVKGMDNNYFNLDFLIHPLGIWEPIASVGSDMWALAWMPTWWSADASDAAMNVTAAAYQSVLASNCWVTTPTPDASGSTAFSPASAEAPAAAPRQSYLQPGALGSKLFPFSPAITTSFFPMIYKQLDGSGTDTTNSSAELLQQVYQYFEHNFARFFDSDGDGVRDCYQYNTALANCTPSETVCETGDYSVWATANLVLGMVLPSPGDDAGYLRRLIQGTAPYLLARNQPKVLDVSYPHVMVSRAVFEEVPTARAPADPTCSCPTAGTLKFAFAAGDNAPATNHTVLLSAGCSAEGIAPSSDSALSPCRPDPAEVNRFLRQCTALTLDGLPYPATLIQASTEGAGNFLLTAPGWSERSGSAQVPQEFELAFC